MGIKSSSIESHTLWQLMWLIWCTAGRSMQSDRSGNLVSLFFRDYYRQSFSKSQLQNRNRNEWPIIRLLMMQGRDVFSGKCFHFSYEIKSSLLIQESFDEGEERGSGGANGGPAVQKTDSKRSRAIRKLLSKTMKVSKGTSINHCNTW